MEPGDVLLTPMGCWHGHSNESDEEAYWIDFLDAPLVQLLGPMFFEHHPDLLETAERVDGSSPMRFAFSDYHPRLLEEQQSEDGVRMLKLGPPSLVTFDRTAIQLSQGAKWFRPKSTVSRIYTVIKGSGRIRFEDREFDWGPGDMIAAPNWRLHEINAETEATLLQVSDEPLMSMLGWVREHPAVSMETA